MARIAGGDWLMQQIGGEVILFHCETEEEIGRFDPADANELSMFQRVIYTARVDGKLNEEEQCFAHMWSGYFYAHATGV